MCVYHQLICYTGRFKGYSKADQNLTMEDLKELLKSVDHEHVVDSSDIISDEALKALLDRSFSSSSSLAVKGEKKAGNSDNGVCSSDHGAHSNLFVVLEEKCDSGNLLKSVNADNTGTRDGGENPPAAEPATEDADKSSTTSADSHNMAMKVAAEPAMEDTDKSSTTSADSHNMAVKVAAEPAMEDADKFSTTSADSHNMAVKVATEPAMEDADKFSTTSADSHNMAVNVAAEPAMEDADKSSKLATTSADFHNMAVEVEQIPLAGGKDVPVPEVENTPLDMVAQPYDHQ